jgi:hypothetical protein
MTRTLRAVRFLATDGRIPRPLRWLVIVGALPVPGPFDEAVLLVGAVPLVIFYRPEMKDAWRHAGSDGHGPLGLAGQSAARESSDTDS